PALSTASYHPSLICFYMTLPHPSSTLFPYTTLFRSSNTCCSKGRRHVQLKKLQGNSTGSAAISMPTHPKNIPAITQKSSMTMLLDRKSTRLNSSHVKISYAVFCLKKKKMKYCH